MLGSKTLSQAPKLFRKDNLITKCTKKTFSAPIDPELGEEFGPRGLGRNEKGRRERRGKGRRAKEAHCPQIYSSRTLHGQAMSQKVKKKFRRGGITTALHLSQSVGEPIHTPHSTHAKFHAFCVSFTHFRPLKCYISRILFSVCYV